MLFIGMWHILIVIGVFLGCSAFLGVSGILSLLWGVWKQIEREQDGWEQQQSAITPDDALGFIRGEDQHAK